MQALGLNTNACWYSTPIFQKYAWEKTPAARGAAVGCGWLQHLCQKRQEVLFITVVMKQSMCRDTVKGSLQGGKKKKKTWCACTNHGWVKSDEHADCQMGEHIKVDWLSHLKQTHFYRSEQRSALMERSPSQWSVQRDNSVRCSVCTLLMCRYTYT